eukprot:1145584-Pyramimonas_sp.AAC.1
MARREFATGPGTHATPLRLARRVDAGMANRAGLGWIPTPRDAQDQLVQTYPIRHPTASAAEPPLTDGASQYGPVY